MSRKRRMFDIEVPEDLATPSPETFPAGKTDADDPRPARRGPMATAIGEAAESGRLRQEIESEIRAENDRLAHEHVRLKRLGLLVDLVPLDAVIMSKLVRDRAKGGDPELAELTESIRELGLSNPIRVEETGQGSYELIQGFRRLSAYRTLFEETGDEAYAKIPAAVTPQGVSLEDLYRRMVDENLVRKDISFAEMAQLALDYANDPNTPVQEPEKAVALLFRSAGYQKRSYVRAFIKVVQAIGPSLSHAPAIPRALGLSLAAKLEAVDGLAVAIRDALAPLGGQDARDEIEVLRRFADDQPQKTDVKTSRTTKASAGKAKTSFQFDRCEGRAKCTAANGRLEVRLERDFSTIDRRKLEEAVRRMLDQLD